MACSDGKGEIGSQVERAMFTETSPEQPEEVLDPQVQSKEVKFCMLQRCVFLFFY
jgi:hypothetical protein